MKKNGYRPKCICLILVGVLQVLAEAVPKSLGYDLELYMTLLEQATALTVDFFCKAVANLFWTQSDILCRKA